MNLATKKVIAEAVGSKKVVPAARKLWKPSKK
jgi:hypothetical protein